MNTQIEIIVGKVFLDYKIINLGPNLAHLSPGSKKSLRQSVSGCNTCSVEHAHVGREAKVLKGSKMLVRNCKTREPGGLVKHRPFSTEMSRPRFVHLNDVRVLRVDVSIPKTHGAYEADS